MDGNRTLWIVVGLIIVALIAYWVYGVNPVDETVETTQEVATSTAEATEIAAARTEAAAELTALRARQEAGETYESLQDEYAAVRGRLSASYANAEGETRQEWAELETEFDSFEAAARANTSGFLSGLSSIISRLSADVRVESAGE